MKKDKKHKTTGTRLILSKPVKIQSHVVKHTFRINHLVKRSISESITWLNVPFRNRYNYFNITEIRFKDNVRNYCGVLPLQQRPFRFEHTAIKLSVLITLC